MQIYISRITGKVVPSPSPLTFTITVPDDFSLVKSITVQDGEIQKTNKNGELLYHQYSKVTTESENYFQKTAEETTESRLVTKTIEKEVTNRWVGEDKMEHSRTVKVIEPIDWIDNEPIMIPNMISKSISFLEDPSQFTIHDIAQEKYSNILENSELDYIIVSMFLNENELDLENNEHSANTGVAFVQLLPNGQIKTKPIILEEPATKFKILEADMDDGIEIYICDKKVINNVVTLDKEVSNCTIKFINTTDKPKLIRSYAIAH